MREDNSRFIFESIEALEVPIALLTADGKVRYVGDPVAVVLAEDRYVARDAAALVDVLAQLGKS